MGKVKITFYGALTKIVEEKTTEFEASTLEEAIGALIARYGEQFKDKIYDEKGNLRRFVNIYVNGKDIRFLDHFATKLNDKDTISIIPAVGGGAPNSNSRVVVKAPSTTANLGPGFDVFGLALDLFHDIVEVTRIKGKGISIEVTGKYASQVPHETRNNTAGVAAKAFLEKLSINSGVRIRLEKGIKPSVGLGSSAASAAATVVALDKLFETNLPKDEIAELAAQGEVASAGVPHADNVSAAIFGGFTVVRRGSRLRVLKFKPPADLRVAVLIPHTPLIEKKTKKAREVLPKASPLELVVENVGNACGIVTGFLRSDISLIGECMKDEIVETARAKFVPHYEKVKEQALREGAVGVAISGAVPAS